MNNLKTIKTSLFIFLSKKGSHKDFFAIAEVWQLDIWVLILKGNEKLLYWNLYSEI